MLALEVSMRLLQLLRVPWPAANLLDHSGNPPLIPAITRVGLTLCFSLKEWNGLRVENSKQSGDSMDRLFVEYFLDDLSCLALR